MDEGDKLDALLRHMVAKQAANEFILDYVLKQIFLELRKQTRLGVASALLDASVQTEWLNGVSKDDFQAERLADMVVQFQEHVDQMIGRALRDTELAEGSKWPPD